MPYFSRGTAPQERGMQNWPMQRGGMGGMGPEDWMRMQMMDKQFERDVTNPFFGADIYETDKSVCVHCDLPGMLTDTIYTIL